MVMGLIYNPDNIEITKKEIYSSVIEYSIPEGYYFESCGTSYGNHIYGRVVLDNYYTVKKREDEKQH
jgi:hypothetical protein